MDIKTINVSVVIHTYRMQIYSMLDTHYTKLYWSFIKLLIYHTAQTNDDDLLTTVPHKARSYSILLI